MYKELQEKVYNWLIEKNKKDKNFTFSVRQKANKGAELNYFIGTEKSNYFSTTFWFIPVSYPGSSSDLINLVFNLQKDKIEYYIQFNQTKSPSNNQNKYDLILVQKVKERLKDQYKRVNYSDEKNKMEFFAIYSTSDYFTFDELKNDLENLLDTVIPIVDEEISKIKSTNPDFIAHRFSPEEQSKMLNKMDERFEKYKIIEELTNDLIEEENEFINLDFVRNQIPLNQILYGPPGTGKTYNTINKALEIINDDEVKALDWNNRTSVKALYDKKVNEGQIVFTTFHQSMTYEDFIEGIKPETINNEVIYDIKDGIFKLISDKAKDNWISNQNEKVNVSFEDAFENLKNIWEEDNDLQFSMKREGKEFTILGFSNKSISFKKSSGGTGHTLSINTLRELFYGDREITNEGVGIYYPPVLEYLNNFSNQKEKNSNLLNFVLIIDEINRGNVSQIFGELITLIEEDKRLGNKEVIKVTLPYSKNEKFGVPSNLYIIGTMNTADRSVEALDTALRRRFVFEEMPPKYKLEGLQQYLYGFKAGDILETINQRIEKLLDRDHLIGHAYFINKDETTIVDSFYKNIIPLLQEYFFGDYGKIGLVLGEGFVDIDKQDQTKSIFASFDYENAQDFDDKKSFKILGLNDKDFNFENAIKLLMNQ